MILASVCEFLKVNRCSPQLFLDPIDDPWSVHSDYDLTFGYGSYDSLTPIDDGVELIVVDLEKYPEAHNIVGEIKHFTGYFDGLIKDGDFVFDQRLEIVVKDDMLTMITAALIMHDTSSDDFYQGFSEALVRAEAREKSWLISDPASFTELLAETRRWVKATIKQQPN